MSRAATVPAARSTTADSAVITGTTPEHFADQLEMYDALTKRNPERLTRPDLDELYKRSTFTPATVTRKSSPKPGVDIAAKTGTAQVSHVSPRSVDPKRVWYFNRDHAWFSGYAPSTAPEVAIVVFVIVVGAFFVRVENYSPFIPPPEGGEGGTGVEQSLPEATGDRLPALGLWRPRPPTRHTQAALWSMPSSPSLR